MGKIFMRSTATILLAGVLYLTGCAAGNFPRIATTTGTVQVSGPSSAVRAGEVVQFSAQVQGPADTSVSWSINGIEGGSNAVGTINASGRFEAPASLPADKQVTVTATSIANPALSGSLSVPLLNPVPVIFSVTAQDSGDSLAVEVVGKNFAPGARINFADLNLSAEVISATQLQVEVPQNAARAASVEVSVSNPEPGASSSDSVIISLTRPTRTPRNFDVATSVPKLPDVPFDYVKYATTDLPQQYTGPNTFGNVVGADNTPLANPITNAGAALGRVLFYDKRLSLNNTVACASCHQQARGFSDPARLSAGYLGGLTSRHAPGLSNARYYQRGFFFWDERAATLEDQVLQPIQNSVEMGMTLSGLQTKLASTSFYPALFQAAFGSTDITSDRISKALAQFVRSMVTYQSKYDQAFAAGTNGTPNFAAVFTASEQRGQKLFGAGPNGGPSLGCDRCHGTAAHISNTIQNNGLDLVTSDVGAGKGQFKSPSLRNIGVRAPYMHDGRFATLDEVVEFYNSGVQNNPDLSPLLRVGGSPTGAVVRLNLSAQDKADLAAFMLTLTDTNFATDPKFSNPFN